MGFHAVVVFCLASSTLFNLTLAILWPASLAFLSEILPTLPQDYAGVQPQGPEGDPEVILLVTFVDWAKIKFVMYGRTDGRTNGRTHGQTET